MDLAALLAPELAPGPERPGTSTDDGRRPAAWPWVVALVVSLGLGLGTPWWSGARASARHPVAADDLARGRDELAGLVVRTGAEPDGYARDLFGDGWADLDGDGCGTREDVLARDLVDVVVDGDGCTVLAGTLDDPYTGATVPFERGERSADVQIDHVVALADAWRSGADAWTGVARTAFANDPANLLAVDGPANQDKGAGDAATWMPPDVGYACVYAVRQVRVKSAYGLSVTHAERDALDDALDGCVVVR